MKTKVITGLAIAALLRVASAQNPCLPEGIVLTSQEQIDSFCVNHPCCTEIIGGVYIGPSGSSNDIENLEGLNRIHAIGGDLVISHNELLESLSGLDGLTTLGGNLGIYFNKRLTSLSGLEGMDNIAGHIGIKGNQALTSLAGLEGVHCLKDYLWIWDNPSLRSLEGLDNLVSVEGHVGIGVNDSLVSLAGLGQLTSVGKYLWIWDNPSLASLCGLEKLNAIGSDLDLYKNPVLHSLSALEGLSSIGGFLVIEENSRLQDLTGLDHIDGGKLEHLVIADNAMLSDCDAGSICEFLSAAKGMAEVHDNAPGCETTAEITGSCDSFVVDVQRLPHLTFYPNPTGTGTITLTLDNPENLRLACFNAFGQQVHQQQICSSVTVINVSGWAPGIYLAVVYDAGKLLGKSKLVLR